MVVMGEERQYHPVDGSDMSKDMQPIFYGASAMFQAMIINLHSGPRRVDITKVYSLYAAPCPTTSLLLALKVYEFWIFW